MLFLSSKRAFFVEEAISLHVDVTTRRIWISGRIVCAFDTTTRTNCAITTFDCKPCSSSRGCKCVCGRCCCRRACLSARGFHCGLSWHSLHCWHCCHSILSSSE